MASACSISDSSHDLAECCSKVTRQKVFKVVKWFVIFSFTEQHPTWAPPEKYVGE